MGGKSSVQESFDSAETSFREVPAALRCNENKKGVPPRVEYVLEAQALKEARDDPRWRRDGEKYIATHLLGRCSAHCGEVIITDNDKHELDRFTLRESGECYVFDDDRIWHMLTPVAVLEGNQYAYRDTVAFDMLPDGWEPAK